MFPSDCPSVRRRPRVRSRHSRFYGLYHELLQRWAIRWGLGCVNSHPAARGSQGRDSRNLGPTLLPISVLNHLVSSSFVHFGTGKRRRRKCANMYKGNAACKLCRKILSAQPYLSVTKCSKASEPLKNLFRIPSMICSRLVSGGMRIMHKMRHPWIHGL